MGVICSQCGKPVDSWQYVSILPVCGRKVCLDKRDEQFEQLRERLRLAAFIHKMTH